MNADAIERFRREIIERTVTVAMENLTDQDLLREVMNTVGKPGRLGEITLCCICGNAYRRLGRQQCYPCAWSIALAPSFYVSRLLAEHSAVSPMN